MKKKHVIALSIISGLVIVALILCLSLIDIGGVKKLSDTDACINLFGGEVL